MLNTINKMKSRLLIIFLFLNINTIIYAQHNSALTNPKHNFEYEIVHSDSIEVKDKFGVITYKSAKTVLFLSKFNDDVVSFEVVSENKLIHYFVLPTFSDLPFIAFITLNTDLVDENNIKQGALFQSKVLNHQVILRRTKDFVLIKNKDSSYIKFY